VLFEDFSRWCIRLVDVRDDGAVLRELEAVVSRIAPLRREGLGLHDRLGVAIVSDELGWCQRKLVLKVILGLDARWDLRRRIQELI
jgi:hypothetical protein